MKISLYLSLAICVCITCGSIVGQENPNDRSPAATPPFEAPPARDKVPDRYRFVPAAQTSAADPAGPGAGNGEGNYVYEQQVTPEGKIVQVVRQVRTGNHAFLGSSDPEAMKFIEAEQEAATEAQRLVASLRSLEGDEKEKEPLMLKLKETLTRQFESQQKRRNAEIAKIEDRLKKLKDTNAKREAAKEAIISRRLDQLSGKSDELGWEETGIGFNPTPAYSVPLSPATGLPNVIPAPPAPRGR